MNWHRTWTGAKTDLKQLIGAKLVAMAHHEHGAACHH